MVTCSIGALRQARKAFLWIGSPLVLALVDLQFQFNVQAECQQTDKWRLMKIFLIEIISPDISSSIEHLRGPNLIKLYWVHTDQYFPLWCHNRPRIFDPAASVHKRTAPRRRAPLSKQVEIRRGPAVLLTVSLSRKRHFIFTSRFILSLS
jgi:hypothetical protein